MTFKREIPISYKINYLPLLCNLFDLYSEQLRYQFIHLWALQTWLTQWIRNVKNIWVSNTRHAIEIWSINTIYSPSPWEHKAIVHRYYLPSCITARSAFLFDNLLRITSTKNYSKIYMSNGHSDSLLMKSSQN